MPYFLPFQPLTRPQSQPQTMELPLKTCFFEFCTLTTGGGGCPYFHTSKRNLQNFPKSAKTLRVGII